MSGKHLYDAVEWSNRHLSRRIRVMEYYGGLRCAICGDDRFGALNIDHIYGGGAKHKRSLGIHNSQGFYRWLDKERPPGYRVLCANDNWLEHLRIRPELSTSSKREAIRRCIERTKSKLFSLIGDACVVCNISDIRILTVHHINNNGAEHRRQVSNGGRGYPFYAATLRSGDFEDLSTMCFSCNVETEWNRKKSLLQV